LELGYLLKANTCVHIYEPIMKVFTPNVAAVPFLCIQSFQLLAL